ncbi:hypothetical protein LTR53_014057 [Teratosphaeriaceae sp. CCFEE 6253]|nr:hypothetical protein LTR53_014057 [Teratosphaeriaceae sp. CCFEE 6253]
MAETRQQCKGGLHLWPESGDLAICTCERLCVYCLVTEGPSPTKYTAFGSLQELRKHVHEEHIAGGRRDKKSVKLLRYDPVVSNECERSGSGDNAAAGPQPGGL